MELIGKRQWYFRKEKLSMSLIRNDRSQDPVTWDVKRSFRLSRMSTFLLTETLSLM